MRFMLSQVACDACPSGVARAGQHYRYELSYTLDQAKAFGLTLGQVFWFLDHLCTRDATVQARLVVWAQQLGMTPQDPIPAKWGNALMWWQVSRVTALRGQGVERQAAKAQAEKEAYDSLIEAFRA